MSKEDIIGWSLIFIPLILISCFIHKNYRRNRNIQLKAVEAEKNIYRSGYNYFCEDGEFWSKAVLEDMARFRIPIPSYPWVDWNNYAQWSLFIFLHKNVLMEFEIIDHNLSVIESLTNDEAQALYVQIRGELKDIKKQIYRSAYLVFENEDDLVRTGYTHLFEVNYFNKYGKFWSESELEEIAGTRFRIPNQRLESSVENSHWLLFRYLHTGVPMELEIIKHNLTIIESLTNDEAAVLDARWRPKNGAF